MAKHILKTGYQWFIGYASVFSQNCHDGRGSNPGNAASGSLPARAPARHRDHQQQAQDRRLVSGVRFRVRVRVRPWPRAEVM